MLCIQNRDIKILLQFIRYKSPNNVGYTVKWWWFVCHFMQCALVHLCKRTNGWLMDFFYAEKLTWPMYLPSRDSKSLFIANDIDATSISRIISFTICQILIYLKSIKWQDAYHLIASTSHPLHRWWRSRRTKFSTIFAFNWARVKLVSISLNVPEIFNNFQWIIIL